MQGKCDVARIDKQNNMDLLKKLHISKFPTTQLFLECVSHLPVVDCL